MTSVVICLNLLNLSKLMCANLYFCTTSMNMCGLGSDVIKFNGLNYTDWYEQIQFQLGVFNLNLAIVMDEMPPVINKTNTIDEKTLCEA